MKIIGSLFLLTFVITLLQLCYGTLHCVGHWLDKANQEKLVSLAYEHKKKNMGLLRDKELYIEKARCKPIHTNWKEDVILKFFWREKEPNYVQVESSTDSHSKLQAKLSLLIDFLPITRSALAQEFVDEVLIIHILENNMETFVDFSWGKSQVSEQNHIHTTLCFALKYRPLKGVFGRNKMYFVVGEFVNCNAQVNDEDLPSLALKQRYKPVKSFSKQHKPMHSPPRRGLLQDYDPLDEVPPTAAIPPPVVAPMETPPPIVGPIATPPVETPPPIVAPIVAPIEAPMETPPPTATIFPPIADMDALAPTINVPINGFHISNVSVFLTGVPLVGLSITPSTILMVKEASRKRHEVEKLFDHQSGRQSYPIGIRQFFQEVIASTGGPILAPPVVAPIVSPMPATVDSGWEPKTPGISNELLVILQVDVGTLLLLLPGSLLENSRHQASVASAWVSIETSSDPLVDVPGAGIQFQGTLTQINTALATLEFGLGLGNGKSKTCYLTIFAFHMYTNNTVLQESQASKRITIFVVGAGAWFTIFQYTKRYYRSSVSVFCFFAMSLLLLCCIIGVCIRHDKKMGKQFDKNRTIIKTQDKTQRETRVFNPLWIPSAAVGPEVDRFVVYHNPKFLQHRQADHLSSLHGPVEDKVESIMNFGGNYHDEAHSGKYLEKIDQMMSSSQPLSSNNASSDTHYLGSDGRPHPTSSPTSARSGSLDSQSTHYTINENRNLAIPASMSMYSSADSNSTHYDIGSP